MDGWRSFASAPGIADLLTPLPFALRFVGMTVAAEQLVTLVDVGGGGGAVWWWLAVDARVVGDAEAVVAFEWYIFGSTSSAELW